MSGSGIRWAICTSAPCSRQKTMPAPHHSVFLQAGCPFCCPTNSVKALKANSMVSGQFKIHVTKKSEKISTTNRAWHVAFGTQFQRHLDRRLFHSVSQPLDFLWTRSIRWTSRCFWWLRHSHGLHCTKAHAYHWYTYNNWMLLFPQVISHYSHTPVWWPFVRDYPGEPVPER